MALLLYLLHMHKALNIHIKLKGMICTLIKLLVDLQEFFSDVGSGGGGGGGGGEKKK